MTGRGIIRKLIGSRCPRCRRVNERGPYLCSSCRDEIAALRAGGRL